MPLTKIKCPIHGVDEWCHSEAGWKRGERGYPRRRLKADAQPSGGKVRAERRFVDTYCICQTEIIPKKTAKPKAAPKRKSRTK
jgi:hypothetical protein